MISYKAISLTGCGQSWPAFTAAVQPVVLISVFQPQAARSPWPVTYWRCVPARRVHCVGSANQRAVCGRARGAGGVGARMMKLVMSYEKLSDARRVKSAGRSDDSGGEAT